MTIQFPDQQYFEAKQISQMEELSFENKCIFTDSPNVNIPTTKNKYKLKKIKTKILLILVLMLF